MIRIPHLKKVIVGSAFVGAFFFASPTAGAQELPASAPTGSDAVTTAVLNQFNSEIARFGAASGVTAAVNQAVSDANTAIAQVQSEIAKWQPVTEQFVAREHNTQQYAQPLHSRSSRWDLD